MIKTFKIRASAIGKIMGGSVGATTAQLKFIKEMEERDKPMTDNMRAKYDEYIYIRDNPELPQGAKAYCENWLKEQLYQIKPEYQNNCTEKGNICEEEAIEMLGYTKNDERKSNEYIEGECDIAPPGENFIWDVKCSWDYSTFPLFKTELPDKDYWWQGQGYMKLWDRDKYAVKYCLMDTPDHLDDRAITYFGLGEPLRIKTFEFPKEDEAITKIYLRVKMCRDYIHSLLNADLLESMVDNSGPDICW